jgi:nucleoside-diphosphate-sugar epimerase
MSNPCVLVTGASGYLALHIVEALLSDGYNVLAAVRSPARETDVRKVAESHSRSSLSFVYVPDIALDRAYDELFKSHSEIIAVIHSASPVSFSAKNPMKDVVDPAIKGTTNMLRAIKAYAPQVKKFVYTSSFATVRKRDIVYPKGKVINEKTWVDASLEDVHASGENAYRVSKVFAEKALWEFVEKEKPNFQATSIIPPIIFGPSLGELNSPDALNLSSGVAYKILTGQLPQDYIIECVDVRDLARAHVVAIQTAASSGKRWLICAGVFVAQEFIEAVNKAGLNGFVVADPKVDVKKILSPMYYTDDSASRKEYGFSLRSLQTIAVDTGRDFIQKGFIGDSKANASPKKKDHHL